MEYAEGHGFRNHKVGKLRDHDHISGIHDARSEHDFGAADDKTLIVEQPVTIQADPQPIRICYYHTHVKTVGGHGVALGVVITARIAGDVAHIKIHAVIGLIDCDACGHRSHKTLAQYALLPCVIPCGHCYDITKSRF